MLQRGTVSLVS